MEEIVLKSKSKTQKLIFVFHGYGSDKNDLLSIGEEFLKAIPAAEIHLPNGIENCEEGIGYQWFSLKAREAEGWNQAFLKNLPKIIAYIQRIMKEKGIDYKDVIFSGFSQGATLSLSLGLAYGAQAVIAFSGLLMDHEGFVCAGNTKILLTHGACDDVTDISAMTSAENTLKNAGLEVKTVISENLCHGIDAYVLSQAVDFLKSV
jgi:phospholipase/carboxylesterase